MKEINGTTYYTKDEVRQMIGCSVDTLNKRIAKAKISGYYIIGHKKWYTADQITQIVEFRNK